MDVLKWSHINNLTQKPVNERQKLNSSLLQQFMQHCSAREDLGVGTLKRKYKCKVLMLVAI